MKHFDLEEWAEFARGTVNDAARSAMEEHIESGCTKCRAYAEVLRGFAMIASSEVRYQVPESEVRSAGAIYEMRKPERVFRLPRLLAHLVYDSFREPLPAGIRTQQRFSRQALFEAGDFRLDMRLEQERTSGHVSLVGQIENRKDPAQRVGSVPVFLSSGREIIAQTMSNQFGEFKLNYQQRTRLKLHVPMLRDRGLQIEVPLQGLLSAPICEDSRLVGERRRVRKKRKQTS